MRLTELTRLKRLMAVQDVSARQLAKAAGWKSHSYMNRLLKGEAVNVEPEPAVRIAKFLGVGVDDLFVARLSTEPAHSGKKHVA